MEQALQQVFQDWPVLGGAYRRLTLPNELRAKQITLLLETFYFLALGCILLYALLSLWKMSGYCAPVAMGILMMNALSATFSLANPFEDESDEKPATRDGVLVELILIAVVLLTLPSLVLCGILPRQWRRANALDTQERVHNDPRAPFVRLVVGTLALYRDAVNSESFQGRMVINIFGTMLEQETEQLRLAMDAFEAVEDEMRAPLLEMLRAPLGSSEAAGATPQLEALYARLSKAYAHVLDARTTIMGTLPQFPDL